MSQDYIQRTAYEAFEGIINNIKRTIKVSFLARVVKYNKERHIADIVPLVTTSDGEISAQLLDVPVSRNCYGLDEYLEKITNNYKPVMRNGAVVVAVIMDKNHDNWEGSGNFKPNTGRLHDINDAIVIGVM